MASGQALRRTRADVHSWGFPGIFRGALDVRAHTITDEMCFATAEAMATYTGKALGPEHILPTMADWDVFAHEAAVVGMKARAQGVARALTEMMMREGFLAQAEA